MESPVFAKRKIRNREQVRFWVEANLYIEFKAQAAKNGLFIQDVFSELMKSFIINSKNGCIKFKE